MLFFARSQVFAFLLVLRLQVIQLLSGLEPVLIGELSDAVLKPSVFDL